MFTRSKLPRLPCNIRVGLYLLLAALYTVHDKPYTRWWRGTVVERRSLAGELSLSCARPAADG